MRSSLSILAIAVVAATLVIPAAASAEVRNRSVTVNRNVAVNRNIAVNRNVVVNRAVVGRPIIGQSYGGGIWYGTGRRFWNGQWFAYGVGPCWLLSPIGYVWVCG